MRTTAAELDAVFEQMLKAAAAAGIDILDVRLIHGSPTYGRMFRVVRVHPIGGGHYSWDGISEHVGATRAECAAILRAVARAYWATTDDRESQPPRRDLHRDGETWPTADDPRRIFPA